MNDEQKKQALFKLYKEKRIEYKAEQYARTAIVQEHFHNRGTKAIRRTRK